MTDDLWKTGLGIASAALSAAVGWVWKKADNAATKQELITTNNNLREITNKLYENAEQDRRRYEERFSHMQDTIHEIHTDILKRLGRGGR